VNSNTLVLRAAVAGKLPEEGAQGVSANTQSAITALGGTVGGGVKGVVDTLGNTVGALGEGVAGTVQGVGDGVGSTVQFAGGAVGAGVGKVGNMFTRSKQQGQGESQTTRKLNAPSLELTVPQLRLLRLKKRICKPRRRRLTRLSPIYLPQCKNRAKMRILVRKTLRRK
jgi:hypothetical protein